MANILNMAEIYHNVEPGQFFPHTSWCALLTEALSNNHKLICCQLTAQDSNCN